MSSPLESESRQRDQEELADLELPYFQKMAILLWSLLVSLLTRLIDLGLLLARPKLLGPYLGIWLAEYQDSPYRSRRSFEVVRALRGTGQRLRELIYGETPLMTALWFFRRAGLGEGSRLVDLGAGRGRVLIAARWRGAEALGVELLASHVERVQKRLSPVGIRLVQGDAGRADLSGATHVFTNWLALTDETKARLVERFRTCAPGTRFITVARPIESPDFARLSRHRLLFTWGFEFVWLHEYRPQAGDVPELGHGSK